MVVTVFPKSCPNANDCRLRGQCGGKLQPDVEKGKDGKNHIIFKCPVGCKVK